MFHAETSAPSVLVLPCFISLSTTETPLTPDGDCVAGYREIDAERALDSRKEVSEPSAATSRAFQKRCVCHLTFRSRYRLGAVPRHGTWPVLFHTFRSSRSLWWYSSHTGDRWPLRPDKAPAIQKNPACVFFEMHLKPEARRGRPKQSLALLTATKAVRRTLRS